MSGPVSFPELLRRSSFASFDPFITRIYRSTPSSVSRHGDWGTKFPINRPKGPGYIKVNNLDAGTFVQQDWRTGEVEARFVKAWGDGRTPWLGQAEIPKMRSFKTEDLVMPATTKEGELPVDDFIEDVNAMSPREFATYLERIRERRGEFIGDKWSRLTENAKSRMTLPEDRTLVHIATKGFANPGDSANFQEMLTKEDKDHATSSTIQSKPHPRFGLAYSRIPFSSASTNPLLHRPGRALDRAANVSAYQRNRPRSELGDARTNLPWTVGIGGLTGKSAPTAKILSDLDPMERGVDYTRSEPSRGEASWKIRTATIDAPPVVLGANEIEFPSVRVRRSPLKERKPLDTFRFDLAVEHASSSPLEVEDESVPGRRDWVAREPFITPASLSFSDRMGLGPRDARNRVPGQAMARIKSHEEDAREMKKTQQENQKTILDLLARLGSNRRKEKEQQEGGGEGEERD